MQIRRRQRSWLKQQYVSYIILGVFSCAIRPLQAQIVTDGSLGPAATLSGPLFQIDAHLGQQHGNNLFHSFQQFDLTAQEIAQFNGPATVNNIIGRVTGGQFSNIDGTVQVNIDSANLYLLNPHGFLFGPNATFDVSGDLHLSTANQVQLDNQGIFASDLTQTSVLSSAPPTAFGFLGDTAGQVQLEGSQITTAPGRTLSITAADITANTAQLTAIAGQINLAAVRHAATVSYDDAGILLKDATVMGTLLLANGTNIDVGKQIAGNIYIRSGRFELNNSEIIANTEGQVAGGIIAIAVDELLLQNRARIDSRTFGPSQSGRIDIRVSGLARLVTSDILTTSRNPNDVVAGNAGSITLLVGTLVLENSTISTDTFSTGQGGDIAIIAEGDVHLLSQQSNSPFFNLTTIQASSRSTDSAAGDAGRIAVRACNLLIAGDNSRIENNTAGPGQGGNIDLVAKRTLTLRDGARITSESNGSGEAGNIALISAELVLNNSVISTETQQADGGNILINARELLQLTQSQITTTVTSGEGNGGNLTISNPWLFQAEDTRLQANANRGNGGLILIVSGRPVIIGENNSISATSESGLDGEIKIDVPNVDLNALPIAFLDASELIRQRCEVRTDEQFSSFIVLGAESLPNAPDDLQSHLPSQEQLQRLLDTIE